MLLVDDVADNNGIAMDEVAAGTSKALSCAVEVHDIASSASEDMLRWFFENRKRSGGGPIEELVYRDKEHRAVITFASPEGTIDLYFIYESFTNYVCKCYTL